jgi:hypothetical protein
MFKPEFVIASDDKPVNGQHMFAIMLDKGDYLPFVLGWNGLVLPLPEKRRDYPYTFHNQPYRINLNLLDDLIDGYPVRQSELFPGRL